MPLSIDRLIVLVVVFFLTSLVSVVTGSTSLITVPAMISMGMESHAAIATNMLALLFMSLGASMSFARSGAVDRTFLTPCILLTILGSGLGALLLFEIPPRPLRATIAAAMIAVSAFALLNPGIGLSTATQPVSPSRRLAAYIATFFLAVYGGLFSGGYVTVLSAVFVVLFGMSFLQSVATTKVMNVFSSAVATMVFLWRGVVDVPLGIVLGITMFFGALLGSRVALRLSAVWLRRIFVAAVLGLAMKMIMLSL